LSLITPDVCSCAAPAVAAIVIFTELKPCDTAAREQYYSNCYGYDASSDHTFCK
jgi:hypothetical protein